MREMRDTVFDAKERLRQLDLAGKTVTLKTVADAITAQHGLPIVYRGVRDLDPARNRTNPIPTGATWIQGGKYVVSYDIDADPLHRAHIILHEFGHILFRHIEVRDSTPTPKPFDPNEQTRNTLFAGLNVDALCSKWVMRDGKFRTRKDEIQAELTATIIALRMIDGLPLPTGRTARDRELARRVAGSLE